MGIPSYFSYIIKNYSNIIRNIEYFIKNQISFDSLYMDCNSIIYDSAHFLEKEHPEIKEEDFEDVLIKMVIKKMEDYIFFIKPKKMVYMAFDGVAPMGKMEQQRKRRYMSLIISKLPLPENKASKFNTVLITPGTKFMDKFSDIIEKHFLKNDEKFGVERLILSSPNEPGEGEHKIFHYMKNNSEYVKNDIVALYGLDSDLIMLSLLHLYRVNNIHIFREAPEFIKSAIPINSYKPSDLYFLDVLKLCKGIVTEMDDNCDMTRINDYVFISFFLGNDFLPSMIGMNLRGSGMLIIMKAYKKKKEKVIKEGGKIDWKSVKSVLCEISKNEEEEIKKEYEEREKKEKRYKNVSEEEKVRNLGIIKREKEKYINPLERGWEERYKKVIGYKEEDKKLYKKKLKSVWKYYMLKGNENRKKVKSVLVKWLLEDEEGEEEEEEEEEEVIEKEKQKRYIFPKETLEMIGELKEGESKEENVEYEYIMKRYIWEGEVKIHNKKCDSIV